MKCQNCGKINEKNGVFCENCGKELNKKKFGEFTGNVIIDTIIWVVIVVLVLDILGQYIIGPLFSMI